MEAPVRLVPEWRAKPRTRRETTIAQEDPAPVVPDPRIDPRGYEAFYHDHHEEWCMPSRRHGDLATQLRNQLGRMAHLCWVATELNTYWIENQNRIYLRPDVIVGWPPEPDLDGLSHRTWDHGLVALVAEIASEESRARDLYTKVCDYAEGVQPYEYLYYDPPNDELVLYRRTLTGYVAVPHAANGWVWSEAVGCWFGVRAHGCLGVYDVEGRAVPDYDEFASRAETEAAARAAAEQIAAAEAAARAAAEQQVRVAEQRAESEAAARAAAEAEAAALREQLAAVVRTPRV